MIVRVWEDETYLGARSITTERRIPGIKEIAKNTRSSLVSWFCNFFAREYVFILLNFATFHTIVHASLVSFCSLIYRLIMAALSYLVVVRTTKWSMSLATRREPGHEKMNFKEGEFSRLNYQKNGERIERSNLK